MNETSIKQGTQTKQKTLSEQEKQAALRHMAEREVSAFWNEYGYNTVIHAARTDIVIAPKPLLGDLVNPEIGKHLLRTILSQVTAKDIMEEKVVVTSETTQFFNLGKQLLLEVPSESLLSKVGGKLTDRIGQALAARENMWGERYLIPRDNGHYSFGEILTPVEKFLSDLGVAASKNPLKSIIRLLASRKN